MDHKDDRQLKILKEIEEMNKILAGIDCTLDDIKLNTSYTDNTDTVSKLCDIIKLIKKPENPIMAEYVWIHPRDNKFCSKIKTITASEDKNADIDLPKETICIYRGEEEESYDLFPVAKSADPFQRKNYVLVFCETYNHNSTPTTLTKNRNQCATFDSRGHSFIFEIEQEFYFDEFNNRKNELPLSVAHRNLGRKILETHYRACLSANIPINSATYVDKNEINYYSYKIGPSGMLEASDYLWLSRYILQRVSEESNVTVHFSLHDNPLHHFYPSTHYYYKFRRDRYFESSYYDKNRKDNAECYIKNMELKHHSDIKYYDSEEGIKSKKIMLEKMKSIEFTERCVKIINLADNECFIRDSRPAGDSDPYIVTSIIVLTCHEELKRLKVI